MKENQEIELKLRLTDDSLYETILAEKLLPELNLAEEWLVFDYNTTYYDTQDYRFMQHGISLRLRQSGEKYVATVKSSGTVQGGLHIRDEYNVELAEADFSVQVFAGLPIYAQLAKILEGEALLPLFRTVFRRYAMDVTTPDNSKINVAVDRGAIVCDEKSEPICEIELELKSGDVTSLLRLGDALSRRYPLILENRSKYGRGLLLCGGAGLQEEAKKKAQKE